MSHTSSPTYVLILRRGYLLAAALGFALILAAVPAALADSDSRDPQGYYPSEVYQGRVESVVTDPTEREFEYLLDAMIPSPHFANYIEYTILALKDHHAERFNGFIDSNFINPPPPSPPAPSPAPGTPEPVVVWPSEAFQNTVALLTQNSTDQEFNYLLDQVLGSTRAVEYVEYIVLDLRTLYAQQVNDFIRYLVMPA